MPGADQDEQPGRPSRLETTASLLIRIRQGDRSAEDLLVERFMPPLKQWAHGRIPASLRSVSDTDDLVQVSFLKALKKVNEFEPRHKGSFLAYLRHVLLNRIRDLIREAKRRPAGGAMDDQIRHPGPSPLEEVIGLEALEAYENALAELPEQKQEAVFLRVEMGFTHEQVARELGLPSANAARMLVTRALVRLAEVMDGR